MEGMKEVGYQFPLTEEEGNVWSLLSVIDKIEAISVLPSSPEILLFLYSHEEKVVEAAMKKVEFVSLPTTQKLSVFM